MPEPRRAVVVGGGISGLTAAWRLARDGCQVDLFEGSGAVGGKLRLGEIAGQQVDVGAEALLAARPEAVGLVHEVGLGEELLHPTQAAAGIWTHGRVCRLPRTLMGIPGDLDDAQESGVLDARAVERARDERHLPPPDLTDDVGIGRLVADRLGPQVRDRLVEPLLGGVYAGRADDISAQAAVPQLVAAVRTHGSLLAAAERAVPTRPRDGGGRSPVFAGLPGGIGRLPQELARRLQRDGHQVRTSATVRELRRTPTGWSLVVGPTNAEEVVEADLVVLATPAVASSRLLADVAPGAAGALTEIAYASMALVTMAFGRERLDPALLERLAGSGFLVPPVDGRTVKAATFSSSKWGWLDAEHFVLRCSIGRAGDVRDLQRPDDELVEAARGDLHDAVGLDAAPVDARVDRWGGGLPQYTVGHLDRVAGIRARVVELPGLEVCGAAYGGVGIPACIADAEAATARLLDSPSRA